MGLLDSRTTVWPWTLLRHGIDHGIGLGLLITRFLTRGAVIILLAGFVLVPRSIMLETLFVTAAVALHEVILVFLVDLARRTTRG